METKITTDPGVGESTSKQDERCLDSSSCNSNKRSIDNDLAKNTRGSDVSRLNTFGDVGSDTTPWILSGNDSVDSAVTDEFRPMLSGIAQICDLRALFLGEAAACEAPPTTMLTILAWSNVLTCNLPGEPEAFTTTDQDLILNIMDDVFIRNIDSIADG